MTAPFLVLLLLQTHPPQVPSKEMRVELAVAQYAGAGRKVGRSGYQEDAQEFGTPHQPTGPGKVSSRTPEHSANLARAAGATQIGTALGLLCTPARAEGCLMKVIRIGVPHFVGDTARVWLYEYEVLLREDAGEEYDRELLLVQKTDKWKVVGVGDSRRAYFQ